MTVKTTSDGLRVVTKGKGDRRISKDNVGARTEPTFEHGDVSLWKFADGQRYTLYLSTDDAYDLADCLDKLLEDMERSGS